MARLGYDRYGAQGGDIGSGVSGMLGMLHPGNVIGVHLNSDPLAVAAVALPPGDEADKAAVTDATGPAWADAPASRPTASATSQLQATRPQTLAYALTDSPVGQLAWIVEKFKEWTDPAAELPEDAVDRDQLLTNVSVYWFTGTGASAAKFLYESGPSPRTGRAPSAGPRGVGGVRRRRRAVRRLIDPDGKIEHWSEFDRGGHFAAMEAPDLLVERRPGVLPQAALRVGPPATGAGACAGRLPRIGGPATLRRWLAAQCAARTSLEAHTWRTGTCSRPSR